MTPGQRAYEACVIERPSYTDGSPRRGWDQLSNTGRMAWERSPHPLLCAPQKVAGN